MTGVQIDLFRYFVEIFVYYFLKTFCGHGQQFLFSVFHFPFWRKKNRFPASFNLCIHSLISSLVDGRAHERRKKNLKKWLFSTERAAGKTLFQQTVRDVRENGELVTNSAKRNLPSHSRRWTQTVNCTFFAKLLKDELGYPIGSNLSRVLNCSDWPSSLTKKNNKMHTLLLNGKRFFESIG